MKDRYVVDTNVLIAASAADPVNPCDIDATPAEPAIRQMVWNWLSSFQKSESRLVLDLAGKIFGEYGNKLGFNDFGLQMTQYKFDRCEIDQVDVRYDQDGHGILEDAHNKVIHDLADRKIVAASLEAKSECGQSCVAFAGDTDWHEWEEYLIQIDFDIEPVIEEWSRAKYLEKQQRKA